MVNLLSNSPVIKTYSGSLGMQEVVGMLFKDIKVILGTVTTSYVADMFLQAKKHKGVVLTDTGLILKVLVEFANNSWVCEVSESKTH